MEKFLVLRTVTEQALANRTCAALEDAGIPVMLEHVIIHDEDTHASGYRILVPSQHTQTALALIESTTMAYQARLEAIENDRRVA